MVGNGQVSVTLASAATTDSPFRGGVLDAGESVTLELSWSIPESAGNVVQSDGVRFTVTVQLRAPP
ncbi:MAG: hypothetical protein ABEJ89_06810 [Haloarculaceae archaeon]